MIFDHLDNNSVQARFNRLRNTATNLPMSEPLWADFQLCFEMIDRLEKELSIAEGKLLISDKRPALLSKEVEKFAKDGSLAA